VLLLLLPAADQPFSSLLGCANPDSDPLGAWCPVDPRSCPSYFGAKQPKPGDVPPSLLNRWAGDVVHACTVTAYDKEGLCDCMLHGVCVNKSICSGCCWLCLARAAMLWLTPLSCLLLCRVYFDYCEPVRNKTEAG
jgi:hypothetical protein